MRATKVVIFAATLSLLAGCSSGASLPADLSSTLTKSVVALSESASKGDEAAALKKLAAIEASVKKSLADGDISKEKAASIQKAIDAVRADLEKVVAAEKQAAADKAAADKLAADEAAAEAEAERLAEEQKDDDDDEDKGKGRGKKDD